MHAHELVDMRARRATPATRVLALDQQAQHVDIVRRARIRLAILDQTAHRLAIVRLDRDAAHQIAGGLDEARLR